MKPIPPPLQLDILRCAHLVTSRREGNTVSCLGNCDGSADVPRRPQTYLEGFC